MFYSMLYSMLYSVVYLVLYSMFHSMIYCFIRFFIPSRYPHGVSLMSEVYTPEGYHVKLYFCVSPISVGAGEKGELTLD